MSRSVHTRPRRVLAPTRVRAPYARRGEAALSRMYRRLRASKELGIVVEGAPSQQPRASRFTVPRIRQSQAPRGWHYPVSRSDLERALRYLGPEVCYGLSGIDLLPPPDLALDRIHFGTLLPPGRIRLYALPCPPWTLQGALPEREFDRLAHAGASIEHSADGLNTVVDWPEQTLRDFVLFDVLPHELGHHLVQQYTGKRKDRVMRTRDHEAYADLFARRCEEELRAS